ncbi:unnamed protein product [Fraxinus pennsylvanica]|uniref:CCHC-type domain-containing protein n=1 Tax=Fraxinus pennsylvanica TaxID=56036 RepID=A0AAD1ZBT1_9LAMI|nr:unnamed protein product [Fraxinus pennsylvanica]
MAEGGSLEDHLNVFKEIVADLETLEVEYDEEDLPLILLCLLPTSFSSLRDTILYSHDTFTIEEVYDALYSKEKMKHLVSEAIDGKGLVDRGGSRRGRSKSKFSNQICNYCKKKGHLKKDCYKLLNKERMAASRYSDTSGEADLVENVVSDGELSTISDIESKSEDDWILDSTCVFHMCHNKDLFATYETVSKDVVIMRNNVSYTSYRVVQNLEESISTSSVPWWAFGLVQCL